MQIIRNSQHILLTPAEMEQAYREREMYYRTKDAAGHAQEICIHKGYHTNILEDSDYKKIAEQFLANYDCNISENELFESVVEEYLDRCILERGELRQDITDN